MGMVAENGCELVVIGLGAMGSAALYQAARRGARVIGLDRHAPPHTLGSTHGETRITRQGIGEGAAYVPLVLRAHQIWDELESATGTRILTRCGALLIARPGDTADRGLRTDFLGRTLQSAKTFGIAHEVLGTDDLRHRFPQFGIADDEVGYYEPGGGWVSPEAAITAQLTEAARMGAELRTKTIVTGLHQHGDGVVVTLADGTTIHADRAILSAGAWVADFLPSAMRPLFQPHRQMLHWFALQAPDLAQTWVNSPVYMWSHGDGQDDFFYGFPSLDGGQTLKVANEQYDALVDPNDFNREVGPEESRRFFDHSLAGRLRGLTPQVVKASTCLYTVTPDSAFVIDDHPDMDRVQLVSPCSGHGFKHSAAIGECAALRALQGASPIDLSAFALSRLTGG